MSGQRDPLILADAAVLIRYLLLLAVGGFLAAGLAGAGFIVTFFALFVLFSLGISYIMLYHTVRGLAIRRVMPHDRAFENAIAHVQVEVDQRSPFSCLLCQVEDRFAPAGRERQIVSVERPLPGGSQTSLSVEFMCLGKRGQYTIGPLRLVAYDSFGMLTMGAGDDEQHAFFIYPPPAEVHDFVMAGQASSFTFGSHASRRLGPGLDFAGIREYRDRDDSRHLHWPASARMGRLMIKEFDHIGAIQVTLFFDLSKESLCGIGRHSTAEYAVKIAASLAKLSLDQGNQVQLLAQGDRLVYLPFGSGFWHFTAIMQELTRARAEGRQQLDQLIHQYIELVPEESHAIIVFSKCDVNIGAYVDSLELLRSRRVGITAVMIDHTTFLPVFETHRYEASREARDRLLRQGVTVYEVKQGDNLAHALSLPVPASLATADEESNVPTPAN